MYASAVSAIPGVRRRLAGMQRELALTSGGVLEGRDIGTKVVPETTAQVLPDGPRPRCVRGGDSWSWRPGGRRSPSRRSSPRWRRATGPTPRATTRPSASTTTYVVVDTSDLDGRRGRRRSFVGRIVGPSAVDRPDAGD